MVDVKSSSRQHLGGFDKSQMDADAVVLSSLTDGGSAWHRIFENWHTLFHFTWFVRLKGNTAF